MSFRRNQLFLIVAITGFMFNGAVDMTRSIIVYSHEINPAYQELKLFVFCRAIVLLGLGVTMLFHQKKNFVYSHIWLLPFCWGYELISWTNYDYRLGYIELLIMLSLLIVLNIGTISTLARNRNLYIVGRMMWLAVTIIQLSVTAYIILNPPQAGYSHAANLLNTAWVLAILITLAETFEYLRLYTKIIPFIAFLSSLFMFIYPFTRISSFYDDGLLVIVLVYLPPISLAVSLFCYFIWLHSFSASKHRMRNLLSIFIAIVATLSGVLFYWLNSIYI